MTETRFAFGRNWHAFAADITEARIAAAEVSLRSMLGVDRLTGHTFLDIGSGSGLFSLAAFRLGASRVHSFDYDPDSVSCTTQTRQRYAPAADTWTVERGSVLDDQYLARLGTFDIVYSWGVLHHTGDLWGAMDRAVRLVNPDGTFFIAIYNDQGVPSRLWWHAKRVYCRQRAIRPVLASLLALYFGARGALGDLVVARTNPFKRYYQPAGLRGMKFWPDLIDWIGGFPFEVAKPEAVLDFCVARGLTLRRLVTTAGVGNNEFVFTRDQSLRPNV
jgi:2-polyprenyl-3-methyl-5-hydroxy-6-metoxy-1,4-benzoquinol methylase